MKKYDIVSASLMKNGYYLDRQNNVVTMTRAYSEKAETLGTEENEKMAAILNAFPNIAFKVADARKRDNKAIKHIHMIKYILRQPNAREALEEMKQVELCSRAMKSPTKYVQDWFEKKYENFRSLVKFDADGNIIFPEEKKESAEAQAEESNITPMKETNTAQAEGSAA